MLCSPFPVDFFCGIVLKIMIILQNVKERSTISSVCSASCEKVKETGILIDKPKRENPKTVRTRENIAAVAESVPEMPSTSIHRRPKELTISETL